MLEGTPRRTGRQIFLVLSMRSKPSRSTEELVEELVGRLEVSASSEMEVFRCFQNQVKDEGGEREEGRGLPEERGMVRRELMLVKSEEGRVDGVDGKEVEDPC